MVLEVKPTKFPRRKKRAEPPNQPNKQKGKNRERWTCDSAPGLQGSRVRTRGPIRRGQLK